MSLGIPTLEDGQWVLDAWRTHIEQCRTFEACDAARERLYRALDNNRNREQRGLTPRDAAWIRVALGLVAERRQEIAVAAVGSAGGL